MDNVLVTGGAGFIGSHLVESLVYRGDTVTVVDNLSSGRLSNLDGVRDQITFIQGDICDEETLMKAAKGSRTIFHQAAVVSVPKSVEDPVGSAMVNDMGTLFVLEAARKNGIKRVVLASSSAVYGDDPKLPKDEEMTPKPMSPYAVQKLTGEYHARLYYELYGVETVCLRYFNVFGPRQDPSSPYSGVISIFMTRAVDKKAPVIFGDGTQFRDFVYVKDVVNANLLAAATEGIGGGRFNVGTGIAVRINQLWEMICMLSGIEIQPTYKPSRPGDIPKSLALIDHARKMLAFQPEMTFEAGLEKTFQWYQNERS